MPRAKPTPLAPLTTLCESSCGKPLPLPPRLARLYGALRLPQPRARPYVISNFVSSLDGVVSLNTKGHASGGDISGFSAQDRMVMGLLRAVADVIVIGAGTLAADHRHVWSAATIFPELADDYRQLSHALGKPDTPLNVVVSGSGELDLSLPLFASGKVAALIVTTGAGMKRLCRQGVPDAVEVRALRRGPRAFSATAILDEVARVNPGKLILVEGGPRLLGDFHAEHLVDEQFLTLAPQIAGRDAGDGRLSLVMGKAFAPGDARWGSLTDVRRGGSHLYLRYSFR